MDFKNILKRSFSDAWHYRTLWWIVLCAAPLFGFFLFSDFNFGVILDQGFFTEKGEPTILDSLMVIKNTGILNTVFTAITQVSAIKLIGFGILILISVIALIAINLLSTQIIYQTTCAISSDKPVKNIFQNLFPSFRTFSTISIFGGIINGFIFSWIFFPYVIGLSNSWSPTYQLVWSIIMVCVFLIIDIILNTLIKWSKYNSVTRDLTLSDSMRLSLTQISTHPWYILKGVVLNGMLYGLFFFIMYYFIQFIAPVSDIMTYVFANIELSSYIQIRFVALIIFAIMSFTYTRFVLHFVWSHIYLNTLKK